MDGFEQNEGIIVIAATNIPEQLDPALTRPGRFDRLVHVPNPDVGGRREILKHYLKDKPLDADVEVEGAGLSQSPHTASAIAHTKLTLSAFIVSEARCSPPSACSRRAAWAVRFRCPPYGRRRWAARGRSSARRGSCLPRRP